MLSTGKYLLRILNLETKEFIFERYFDDQFNDATLSRDEDIIVVCFDDRIEAINFRTGDMICSIAKVINELDYVDFMIHHNKYFIISTELPRYNSEGAQIGRQVSTELWDTRSAPWTLLHTWMPHKRSRMNGGSRVRSFRAIPIVHRVLFFFGGLTLLIEVISLIFSRIGRGSSIKTNYWCSSTCGTWRWAMTQERFLAAFIMSAASMEYPRACIRSKDSQFQHTSILSRMLISSASVFFFFFFFFFFVLQISSDRIDGVGR
jgi:hypothetical protein